MTRKNLRFAVGMMVALLMIMPAAAAAQQKTTEPYPDIGIMNSVLEQLLESVRGQSHASFDVSGAYIPGYGLLFVATGANRFLGANLPTHIEELSMKAVDSSMVVIDSAMKEYDEAMRKHDSSLAKHDSIIVPPVPRIRIHPPRIIIRSLEEKESSKLSKEEIGRLDKSVMRFLESYADAENKLSPTQHISVVVITGGASSARYYSVTRKEVSDFRSGTETSKSLRQHVQIANLKEKHDSVEIMETILDKAIGGESTGAINSIFGPRSTGIYLKGLGAFFTCKLTGLPDFDRSADMLKRSKNETAKLEDRIVRTLGTYGSSLRFLPEGESILVSLQLDQFGTGNKSVLIALKKKDIDSYSRNQISYDALRKRALIIQNQ